MLSDPDKPELLTHHLNANTISSEAALQIAAQVVLQNYMFERFLERLSRSEYQQKFVIKGGMLVTAIVGIDTRATMDLDTTLRNLPLTEPQIRDAITAICNVPVDDEKAAVTGMMMRSFRYQRNVILQSVLDVDNGLPDH